MSQDLNPWSTVKRKRAVKYEGSIVYVRDLRPGDVYVGLHQHANTPRKTQTPMEVVEIGQIFNGSERSIKTGAESWLYYAQDAKVWLFPRKEEAGDGAQA